MAAPAGVPLRRLLPPHPFDSASKGALYKKAVQGAGRENRRARHSFFPRSASLDIKPRWHPVPCPIPFISCPNLPTSTRHRIKDPIYITKPQLAPTPTSRSSLLSPNPPFRLSRIFFYILYSAQLTRPCYFLTSAAPASPRFGRAYVRLLVVHLAPRGRPNLHQVSYKPATYLSCRSCGSASIQVGR